MLIHVLLGSMCSRVHAEEVATSVEGAVVLEDVITCMCGTPIHHRVSNHMVHWSSCVCWSDGLHNVCRLVLPALSLASVFSVARRKKQCY